MEKINIEKYLKLSEEEKSIKSKKDIDELYNSLNEKQKEDLIYISKMIDYEVSCLKKQLKEKEHDIDRITKSCLEGINNQATIIAKQHEKIRELKYNLQTNIKQVCEKIKNLGIEQIDYYVDFKGSEKFRGWLITPEILDQIEYGENYVN